MKPDDDLTTLFQNLDPIEAKPEFLRTLREIPLRNARSGRFLLGVLFGDFRFGAAVVASLLLGVGLGMSDWVATNSGDDVVAFLDLDTTAGLTEPFDVGLLE